MYMHVYTIFVCVCVRVCIRVCTFARSKREITTREREVWFLLRHFRCTRERLNCRFVNSNSTSSCFSFFFSPSPSPSPAPALPSPTPTTTTGYIAATAVPRRAALPPPLLLLLLLRFCCCCRYYYYYYLLLLLLLFPARTSGTDHTSQHASTYVSPKASTIRECGNDIRGESERTRACARARKLARFDFSRLDRECGEQRSTRASRAR